MSLTEQDTTKWVAEFMDTFLRQCEKLDIQFVGTFQFPSGHVTTKNTDNFYSIPEMLGLYDAGKFQNQLVVWQVVQGTRKIYSEGAGKSFMDNRDRKGNDEPI